MHGFATFLYLVMTLPLMPWNWQNALHKMSESNSVYCTDRGHTYSHRAKSCTRYPLQTATVI